MIVQGTFNLKYGGDEFDIEINKDNVVLKDWYYFTQYGPEHTIGLTLRDLEVAKSVYEEEELTKDWSILE